jgi:hypothetical protein
MCTYETFVARHGEAGVQALIEMIERHSGICIRFEAQLEQRWADLIGQDGAAGELAGVS